MKYKISEKFEPNEIPEIEGYRLIQSWELDKLSQKDKKIENLLREEYVWADSEFGLRACRLGIFGGDSDFYAVDFGVDSHGALRGVFVKKETKRRINKTPTKMKGVKEVKNEI